MDNTSEARRKKIMRRKRAMLKRTHRRINVTFIIVFVLLLVLGVKIFMINYTHGDTYAKAVLDHQTYTSTELPYKRGQESGCDYCPYRQVCGFDVKIPGYEYRDIGTTGKEEAMEAMRMEQKGGE